MRMHTAHKIAAPKRERLLLLNISYHRIFETTAKMSSAIWRGANQVQVCEICQEPMQDPIPSQAEDMYPLYIFLP